MVFCSSLEILFRSTLRHCASKIDLNSSKRKSKRLYPKFVETVDISYFGYNYHLLYFVYLLHPATFLFSQMNNHSREFKSFLASSLEAFGLLSHFNAFEPATIANPNRQCKTQGKLLLLVWQNTLFFNFALIIQWCRCTSALY